MGSGGADSLDALLGDALLVILGAGAAIHLLAFLLMFAGTARLAAGTRAGLLFLCLFVPLAGPVLAVLTAFSSRVPVRAAGAR